MKYKELKKYIKAIKDFRVEQDEAGESLKIICDERAYVTLGDGLFDAYVKALEELTGDTGWINWWVYESYCGEQTDKWAYSSPDRSAPKTLKEIYKKIYPLQPLEVALKRYHKVVDED